MSSFGTGTPGGYTITWEDSGESTDIKGYVSESPTSAGTRGERYLPSGQLVEWELSVFGLSPRPARNRLEELANLRIANCTKTAPDSDDEAEKPPF